MKLIAYADSYNYYGLWDDTMGYFDNNGNYKALPTFCKTTDVYNICGTRDSLTIYISVADNLLIDRLAYVAIQRAFKDQKVKKENITIRYYSKNFEKLIPSIMKKYANVDYDVKITFLYEPKSEQELFDENEAYELAKEFGWNDKKTIKEALLSA